MLIVDRDGRARLNISSSSTACLLNRATLFHTFAIHCSCKTGEKRNINQSDIVANNRALPIELLKRKSRTVDGLVFSGKSSLWLPEICEGAVEERKKDTHRISKECNNFVCGRQENGE